MVSGTALPAYGRPGPPAAGFWAELQERRNASERARVRLSRRPPPRHALSAPFVAAMGHRTPRSWTAAGMPSWPSTWTALARERARLAQLPRRALAVLPLAAPKQCLAPMQPLGAVAESTSGSSSPCWRRWGSGPLRTSCFRSSARSTPISAARLTSPSSCASSRSKRRRRLPTTTSRTSSTRSWRAAGTRTSPESVSSGPPHVPHCSPTACARARKLCSAALRWAHAPRQSTPHSCATLAGRAVSGVVMCAVKKETLVKIIKEDFGLTIDIEELIDGEHGGLLDAAGALSGSVCGGGRLATRVSDRCRAGRMRRDAAWLCCCHLRSTC